MAQISVLGLGHWGTALGNHLALNGHHVLGWTIDAGVADGINKTHRNQRFLSEQQLDLKFTATENLAAALRSKYLLLVLPSAALGEFVPKLKVEKESIIISAVKGFEAASVLTPLSFIGQTHKQPLAVISGPTFARDLILRKPLSAVVAAKELSTATEVAELFFGENFKPYISTDPLGVELGGILKNVIALAAGVSDGLELGDSARAALITRGLAEMMRLAKALGAEAQTLFGLSGLGDLIMTASSDTSRNRTVGLRLGRGEKLDFIIKSLGSVAEGVSTTPLVLKLAQKHKVEMPIALYISKLLNGEITANETARALLSRPLRKEFD